MRKWLMFLVGVAMVAACGPSYEEQKKMTRAEQLRLAAENRAALKIAVMPTIDCMPVYLAKSAAWFDSMAVDIRLKRWNAQMDCDTALKGKSVEVAVTDRKRVEHMTEAKTALLTMGSTNAYWQLIANRVTRVKNVSQLSDKMIAMTRYSATDYLTEKALAGIKTSAPVFRIQINDVQTRLDMLKNNEMDAAWLAEPQATAARRYKHVVIMDSRKMDEKLGVVVMRSELLDDAKRKEQLSAFIKGYNRACDSLNTYGLKHYRNVIKAFCNSDDDVIEALPDFYFPHIGFPERK